MPGIGFTMALFIAELAFSSTLVDSAELGIFTASALSASMGLAVLIRASARRPQDDKLGKLQ